MNKHFYQIERIFASAGQCSFCKVDFKNEHYNFIYVNKDVAKLIWFMLKHEKAINGKHFDFCTLREENGIFYCYAYELIYDSDCLTVIHKTVSQPAFAHLLQQYEKRNRIDFSSMEHLLETAHDVDKTSLQFFGKITLENLYRFCNAIKPIDEAVYFAPNSRIITKEFETQ